MFTVTTIDGEEIAADRVSVDQTWVYVYKNAVVIEEQTAGPWYRKRKTLVACDRPRCVRVINKDEISDVQLI
jgi:hypothetical protein